jgi:hypothetical protein
MTVQGTHRPAPVSKWNKITFMKNHGLNESVVLGRPVLRQVTRIAVVPSEKM